MYLKFAIHDVLFLYVSAHAASWPSFETRRTKLGPNILQTTTSKEIRSKRKSKRAEEIEIENRKGSCEDKSLLYAHYMLQVWDQIEY